MWKWSRKERHCLSPWTICWTLPAWIKTCPRDAGIWAVGVHISLDMEKEKLERYQVVTESGICWSLSGWHGSGIVPSRHPLLPHPARCLSVYPSVGVTEHAWLLRVSLSFFFRWLFWGVTYTALKSLIWVSSSRICWYIWRIVHPPPPSNLRTFLIPPKDPLCLLGVALLLFALVSTGSYPAWVVVCTQYVIVTVNVIL